MFEEDEEEFKSGTSDCEVLAKVPVTLHLTGQELMQMQISNALFLLGEMYHQQPTIGLCEDCVEVAKHLAHRTHRQLEKLEGFGVE